MNVKINNRRVANHQYSLVVFLLPKTRTNERRAEMERLTEKNDETYFYPHCFGEECIGVSEPCSECEFEEKICMRLGEYEDTGLTPPEIMKLKERDTAKKIEINAGILTCPVCGRRIVKCYDFCPDCGQRLEQ